MLDLSAVPANVVHAPLVRWTSLVWAGARLRPRVVGTSRFASASESFRTTYAAEDVETLLAEVLLRPGGLAGDGFVRMSALEKLEVVELGTEEAAELLDLTGDAIHRLADGMRVRDHFVGDAENILADELHEGTAVDGIVYGSRHAGGRCIAVFERSASRLVVSARTPLLEVADLDRILLTLKLGVRSDDP